jgi:hypothetical protein
LLTFEKGLANGFLFSLSARLARYTGNKTYADWADKTWDWAEKIGLIDHDYAVYKGAAVMQDCRFINKHQWTSSNAIFVLGASYMYNYVGCLFPPLQYPLRTYRGKRIRLTLCVDKWGRQVAKSH